MKKIVYNLIKINIIIEIILQISHAMNKPLSEQQESSQKIKLIFQAFQGIGVSPSFALIHQNEVDVFVSLPPNFIKFVNAPNDIPTNKFPSIPQKNYPLHHCDFTSEIKHDKENSYFHHPIKLDHYRPNQSTITLSLWSHATSEIKSETRKIFITPDSAIFHIDISKIDTHNRRLKLGLGGLVSEGMKHGFYVVAPKTIDQIDWKKDEEILSLLKSRMRHEYSDLIK